MSKTDLSSFDNSWYKPGSRIKRGLWYLTNLFFVMNPLLPVSGVKKFFLRLYGAKIGNEVVIKPRVNIKYPWNLEIGNQVWIGESVWIDNLSKVKIEDNVCVSQGAMLLCGNHNYKISSFDLIVGDILLEEGSWVGAQAIVCPGVICKSHSVLTVQSVAVRNLEEYGIYQGNPAVLIKKRTIES